MEYETGWLFERYMKPYTAEDTKLKPLHVHMRALRATIKLFLSHYFSFVRESFGFDSRELYVQEQMGHKNIVTWRKALAMENTYMPKTNTKEGTEQFEEEQYKRKKESVARFMDSEYESNPNQAITEEKILEKRAEVHEH